MGKLPCKEAKNYALKLFQLLFSREEAGTSSVEGKGDMLKKLDPNRMDALRENTKSSFLTNQLNGQKLRLPSNANVEWSEMDGVELGLKDFCYNYTYTCMSCCQCQCQTAAWN